MSGPATTVYANGKANEQPAERATSPSSPPPRHAGRWASGRSAGRQQYLKCRNSPPAPPPSPPVYPIEPHHMTHHGDTRVDDYHWLANRKDTRVKHLIERENAALEHFFLEYERQQQERRPPQRSESCSPLSPSPPSPPPVQASSLRKQLFREMKRRWKEDDVSLPTLDRGYWYYVRQVKNAEYPLFCRRPYNKEAGVNVHFVDEMCDFWRENPTAVMPCFEDEVVFLDVNLLVRELRLSFVDVGEMDISPDESQLAVTLDCSDGKEVFTLFIMPIRNVNYAQWLERDSDALHRVWAKELEQTHQSVYSPLTPASSLGASSPASSGSGSFGFPKAKRKTKPRKVPASRSGGAPDGGSPSAQSLPPPRHTIKTTIDIFDLSGEVLWVSPTSLLYITLDEKQRKCQVVYHDLTIADPSDASFIVFEEEDEAFWVSSICFSSDDAYVLFCSSSTEVSEWYAVPVSAMAMQALPAGGGDSPPLAPPASPDGAAARPEAAVPPTLWESRACENRTLSRVPTAQEKLMVEITSKKERLPRDRLHTAPVLQFSSREQCPVEYDLDHHKALLSENEEQGGAWLLVGNPHPCTNFAVFVLPDQVTREHWALQGVATEDETTPAMQLYSFTGSNSSSSSSSSDGDTSGKPRDATALWLPLFAYDEDVKVDGVENFYHFLLLSVRCHGHPTTLFCPVQRVRTWWATTRGSWLQSGQATPMSLTADAFDLSTLLTMFPAQLHLATSSQCSTAPAVSSAPPVCVAKLTSTASGGVQGVAESAREPRDNDGGSVAAPLHVVPAEVAAMEDVQATPLPYAVECYGDCTSYYTTRWRMSVTHLLHPSTQLQCEYVHQGPPSPSETEDDLGSLHIFVLRKEVVNGMDEYRAEDYDGAVIWVPSDHYATTASAAVLVPTKEPSPVARIPVTVCWRRNVFRLGAGPMVVHVYGGYGDSDDPEFSTERLSLLDRGLAWAYAAVRGGGELGIPWRDAGRKLQRATTVNDYVSVASYLQDTGLCQPGRLVACGGSAGGVAVCRAMHQAPELFFAVIGSAPFVDCLTSLLDDDMPLSVTEREEFGDPVTDAEAYRLIKSLSPTDTVEELVERVAASRPHRAAAAHMHTDSPAVPHVLLVASWEDTRVGYWEPMKLAAALRAKVYKPLQEEIAQSAQQAGGEAGTSGSCGSAPPSTMTTTRYPHLYFCCDFDAGHAGPSGRYEQLKEIAREYAFLLCLLQRHGPM